MSSGSHWRTLGLTNGAPKLLLKADFTSSSYDVQLTDLCRVWRESLNKRDIIRRALDDNPSIDPSEDDEQFSIFLGKVESAFDGENDTRLEISSINDTDIDLKLSVRLPKPLPIFVWNACMKKQDEGAVGNVLTMPLLSQASDLQSQVQSLISELHEKDRVISKIADRLETSGNDLTTVFPGVSNVKTNRKKTQREQLARHVKGLSDFNEAAWRGKRVRSGESDIWCRAGEIMTNLPGHESSTSNQMAVGEWWRTLRGSNSIEQEPQKCSPRAKGLSKEVDSGGISKEDSMLDDGFQRQDTPDHLGRKTSIQSNATEGNEQIQSTTEDQPLEPVQQNDGDSTTEDEDDPDASFKSKPMASTKSHSPPSKPYVASPRPSKKLGAIGGGSLKPPPSPAKTPTPELQARPQTEARSRLSLFGGKMKALGESATDSHRDKTESSPPAAARKMGVLGGKRKPSNATPSAVVSPKADEVLDERSRALTKDPTPSPRETSQERADNKRDALKKELEQKAKAPAKKKRRF